MGCSGWMKSTPLSEQRSPKKTSLIQRYIFDCEEIQFGILVLVENLFDCSFHLNFLADSETQALEESVIFQQTHPLFASVTIYTTVDQPPPRKSGRH